MATGKTHDSGFIAGVGLVRETRTDTAWGREMRLAGPRRRMENERGCRGKGYKKWVLPDRGWGEIVRPKASHAVDFGDRAQKKAPEGASLLAYMPYRLKRPPVLIA